MALGRLFGKLFGGSSGGGAPAEAEPVEYKGFQIVAAPIDEGGQYRTAGYIRQDVDGELKQSRFIRADNHTARDAAVEHSISKARQIIDEQGAALLDRELL